VTTVETTKRRVSEGSRRFGKLLVGAAVIPAAITSGWGMWTTIADIVGATAADQKMELIVPIFLLFDLAALACAVNARINRVAYGRMGVEGWLVWAFAVLSGLMSMSEGTSGKERALRFAAPLVAAVLFELLIRGERKDATGELGVVEILLRRWKARFGLGQPEQSEREQERAAMCSRLAALAYRMHGLPQGWRRRRATARYHRKLRVANQRYGFGADAEMVAATRQHLAALYQSVSGTSETAVGDLNLWRAANHETGQGAREHTTGPTGHVPEAGHNGHAGRVPASTAPEVPAQTARGDVPETGDGGEQSARGQGARRRSDEELLGQYGDQLVREWLEAGEQGLTPYRVRKVCGGDGPVLAERQGKRIFAAVQERVAQARTEAAAAAAELEGR
jgi:hypothetical protein